jgi:hypothetical protein
LFLVASLIGDSYPGDVNGDWDSPPIAKGKKTAGLDNNDFMFIGTKEELVSLTCTCTW